jgi:hypothetical protein
MIRSGHNDGSELTSRFIAQLAETIPRQMDLLLADEWTTIFRRSDFSFAVNENHYPKFLSADVYVFGL